MGSMVKADSERRELVRERRHARIERKQQRRNARERKRSQFAGAPPAVSAVQRAAEERVDAAVDRTVTEALERHDQVTAAANMHRPSGEAHRQCETAEAAGDRGAAPGPRGAAARQLHDRAHRRNKPCVTAQTTPAARAGERRHAA